ncbi:uncharacterized protein B0I36DRAFT_316810 [Microdochium trichocladiopsis]|uniref:Uncharacterized protein n=1 Tax=Microdochium trichocladiopsis TaxID=1682393 RepID=A0A9P8YB50_9PEZI|nr:uncharacterized protein B0I36DRAFT_316810 [Microdochium trichocladiopsis]KAH7034720.1 hypothetical protein B0I36DRAFT_316810 [Microdochium trichocladiopsis]
MKRRTCGPEEIVIRDCDANVHDGFGQRALLFCRDLTQRRSRDCEILCRTSKRL